VTGGFAVLFIAAGADAGALPGGIGVALFLVAFTLRTGLVSRRVVSKNLVSVLYVLAAVLVLITAFSGVWPSTVLAAYCLYRAWSSPRLPLDYSRGDRV
jgi:hypothetical protein